MNELDSTVAALALDPASGSMQVIDVVAAVPDEARNANHCADIRISPDGRFLYGSNRGHDSIAVFAIDQPSGRPGLVDFFPCGGPTPRNLCLTPSGRHLFSANQNGDRVAIFARDDATGRLADTGCGIDVGTPMCVQMTI